MMEGFPVDAVPARTRVARHASRLREVGLTKISVWVPPERKDAVHTLAKQLRVEKGKELPKDGLDKHGEVARRGPGSQGPGDAVRSPVVRQLQDELIRARARIADLEGLERVAIRLKARVLELEEAAQPLRKIGRNEPCPCGSGKKYKRCCA